MSDKKKDDFNIPNMLENFFSKDWFDLPKMATTGTSVPAVNILETRDEYIVEVAAPGLNKGDFNVEVDNNLLTISSEKEGGAEELFDKGKYTKREFKFSTFSRSFTLPEAAEGENISAKYENGILYVIVAKKDDHKEKPTRTIEIL